MGSGGEQMARLQEQARFVGVAAGNAGVGFDEGRWLSRVRESMAERAAEELGAAAVKVFDVPRVLRSTRPEAYAPHHFALGPYHCRRPELRDMERYKLAAAKRAEKLFAAGKRFDDLVRRFSDIHDKILAPYHSAVRRRPGLCPPVRRGEAAGRRIYQWDDGEGRRGVRGEKLEKRKRKGCWGREGEELEERRRRKRKRWDEEIRLLELNEQTLAWMMAIDTCFLLDFLESYHRDEATDMVSSAANWINAVVRDAIMLENQIPLFLFAAALELRHGTDQAQAASAAADALRGVLGRFITEVSPIKTTASAALAVAGDDLARHAHLLELLYHFLVPTDAVAEAVGNEPPPLVPEDFSAVDVFDQMQKEIPDYDKVKQACVQVSSLDMAPIRFIKKNLISRPMGLAASLPGKLMRKVPLLSAVAPLVGKLWSSSSSAADMEARLKGVNLGTIINSPLAQELMIPSVAQLAACGVRFAPAPEGIAGIEFDAPAATLKLPVITVDGNTETVLRNLVAYEAVAVRGPLVLARYTELMNGIIDTAKDVKILRQSGVVVNRMKSDGEAAEMWNGMCRATRLSRVPRLDGVIRAVNEHRSRRAAVRLRRMMKRYVFRSWRVLTLLAAVVLLLMTALQTFCSVYQCNRWFGNMLQMPQPGGKGP
uniref:Pentatricopeptide (PPR) repeat-containing protein-like n=1 Tax=Oryza sativa subsp. japonica TaxID=39947 RepID=Q6ZCP9_ORYSJ|nr:pentatricopeptide (PPR) repeat-containing protein-like [Oryza sativa Japonica Group]